MDGDLGARLQSVLSDPDQMAKLGEMAKGLMGQLGQNPPPAEQQSNDAQPQEIPAADTRLLSALGRALAGGGENNSRSTALLMAMRPYMKPEKQEKLDRAMKIARMAHIAGTVMREYGGGNGI